MQQYMRANKEKPIGVFDSGVGGLSAVKAILKIAPNERIVYFGDTARVPYGSRDFETVSIYAEQDLRFILKHDVKAVLVACGTISSIALQRLKEMTNVPIFGIIDFAVESAIKKTHNGKIAILATEATISSGAFETAIKNKMPEAAIIGVPCPLFVPLVENGYINDDNLVSRMVAEEYLKKVREFGADTIILGCTHFPLLKTIIGQLVEDIIIVDASKEAAVGIFSMIETNDKIKPADIDEYFASGSIENFKKIGSFFVGEAFSGNIKRVSMADYVIF